MGIIKFILWVMLIYYFFKLVFQGLSKYLLKKVQKQQETFGQQFGGGEVNFNDIFKQQKAEQEAKVGETTIKENSKTEGKKLNKDLGEYIDYEEA